MNSLGQISKSFLVQRNLPIHYFIQCLIASVDCLRELANDDLSFANTKIVYVDTNGAIPFPAGFQDVISLSVGVGQRTRPLVPDSTLNSLQNYTTHGNIEPYTTSINPSQSGYQNNTYLNWAWSLNVNSYGQWLGRSFGYTGVYNDGYKVIYSREQIQLNEYIADTQAILEYATDGMNADAATRIHSYAVGAVRAYIEWQYDFKGSAGTAGEMKFGNERKKLRARKNDLTPEKLKRIFDQSAGVR